MVPDSPRGSRRPHPAARIAIAAAVVLVVALVLFAAFFDWNRLRGPIERHASAASGRPVHIRGPLEVHLLSLTPSVRVKGLEIGDPTAVPAEPGAPVGPAVPPAGATGITASLPQAGMSVRLLPLFIGRLVIEEIDLEAPSVNLWRDAAGHDNWEWGRPAASGAHSGRSTRIPVIHRVAVHNGHLEFHDAKRKLEFQGALNAVDSSVSARVEGFQLSGAGLVNGKPFKLEVHGDSLLDVEARRPYHLAGDVRAAGTHLAMEGTLPKPFDLNEFQANLNVAGPDLADLYYLTGLPFMNTPSYTLRGEVRRRAARIDVDHMVGQLGDSDLAGSLAIDLAHERPLLDADLASRRLDVGDLLPAFGAAAKRSGGPSAPPGEKIGASVPPPGGILPDAVLDVERLRAANARVHYRADDLKANRLQLRHLDFKLALQDGVLTLDPFLFTLPEGRVLGNMRIDARGNVPRSALDMRLTGIQLAEFAHGDPASPPVSGELQARLQLEGIGSSVHAVAASSDGRVTAIVPGGSLRHSLAELAGIDPLNALGLLIANNKADSNLRCGVLAFQVHDGTMGVEKLVFDTDPVIVTGRGTVNLGPETWDLSLRGAPKHPQIMRLRTPITITGPLGKPRIGVDKGSLAKQLLIGGALAVATPVAALLAFVDPGLAKNANCTALVDDAVREEHAPRH